MASAEDKVLKDPKREEVLRGAGVPLTIVRAARIKDAPGGASEIVLRQGGGGAAGSSGALRRLPCCLAARLSECRLPAACLTDNSYGTACCLGSSWCWDLARTEPNCCVVVTGPGTSCNCLNLLAYACNSL